MLAYTVTKLKGNEEVSWYGVNGIIASVQEMERAKEGVVILLKDVWHSTLMDSGYVSPRILCIKFKFSRVKVCVVVVGYSPNESGEERDRFCNDMDMIVDRVGIGYRIMHSGRSKWMDWKCAFGVP